MPLVRQEGRGWVLRPSALHLQLSSAYSSHPAPSPGWVCRARCRWGWCAACLQSRSTRGGWWRSSWQPAPGEGAVGQGQVEGFVGMVARWRVCCSLPRLTRRRATSIPSHPAAGFLTLSDAQTMPRPVGMDSAFWLPVTATSTRHLSNWKSCGAGQSAARPGRQLSAVSCASSPAWLH